MTTEPSHGFGGSFLGHEEEGPGEVWGRVSGSIMEAHHRDVMIEVHSKERKARVAGG